MAEVCGSMAQQYCSPFPSLIVLAFHFHVSIILPVSPHVLVPAVGVRMSAGAECVVEDRKTVLRVTGLLAKCLTPLCWNLLQVGIARSGERLRSIWISLIVSYSSYVLGEFHLPTRRHRRSSTRCVLQDFSLFFDLVSSILYFRISTALERQVT